MTDYHQSLIDQYNGVRQVQKKLRKKALILEILTIAIVCSMKAFQSSVSTTLNTIASVMVSGIVIYHFLDFKYRASLEKRIADTVAEGIQIEQKQALSKPPFFRKYLNDFNFFSEVIGYLLFDFLLLFFFSVSITQTIKSINPEIVSKIMPSAPLRTFLINGILVGLYYISFKPILKIKRDNSLV